MKKIGKCHLGNNFINTFINVLYSHVHQKKKTQIVRSFDADLQLVHNLRMKYYKICLVSYSNN